MSHGTSHIPAWQDLLQTPLHAQGTQLQAASSAQGACDTGNPLERGCSMELPGEDVATEPCTETTRTRWQMNFAKELSAALEAAVIPDEGG